MGIFLLSFYWILPIAKLLGRLLPLDFFPSSYLNGHTASCNITYLPPRYHLLPSEWVATHHSERDRKTCRLLWPFSKECGKFYGLIFQVWAHQLIRFRENRESWPPSLSPSLRIKDTQNSKAVARRCSSK